MDKNWFINTYNEIHENLNLIEKEIEHHIKNKSEILGKNEIIEDLKKRALLEIERLNKTREYERKLFNY